MSNQPYWQDDDIENPYGGQESNAIKALREKAEADSKALKEMREQLNAYQTRERERTIGEVLSSKGFDPRVARLIPKDLEPDPVEVEKWLGEWGGLFSAKAPEGAPEDPTPTPAPTGPQPTPQDLAAQRQIAEAGVGGSPTGEMDDVSKIRAATTREELDALIASYR